MDKTKQSLLQKHITNGYCLVKGKGIIEMMNLKKSSDGRRKKKIKKTCYKGKSESIPSGE